jgi:hypothetical protein
MISAKDMILKNKSLLNNFNELTLNKNYDMLQEEAIAFGVLSIGFIKIKNILNLNLNAFEILEHINKSNQE